ncbi:MAG: transporter [Crocinitomicaceae bacterium]|nr:transporter [Crocinitomicaceae bacterium]
MKSFIFPVLGTILLCSNLSLAQENQWSATRPDGHAPISVMGDHMHHKGEWMVSARFMPMTMSGCLSGTGDINNDRIYDDFMAAPQDMQMTMSMIGVMYAPTDYITLMVMGNYLTNAMDLETGMGMEFSTASAGFGDANFGGLIKILNQNKNALHANIGISIPTGNIDQRDDTPMMMNAQLAYPMQLGSGTFDPYLGLTYFGQSDFLSWGAQSMYKMRLAENSETYTFGNKLNASAWVAFKATDALSFSVSATYWNTAKISGADPDLNPMMMPLFSTMNSGRSQLDLGIGTNFLVDSGKLKNLRIGAEVKLPVYQNVNGIQMKNGPMGTIGVQYAIGH